MCNRIDSLIGRKFGNLVVESLSRKDSASRNYFTCICSCGNSKVVQQSNLLSGRSTSCGCSRRIIKIKENGHEAKTFTDDLTKDLKIANPLILMDNFALNIGDVVVVKWSEATGTVTNFVGCNEFDIVLNEDGSLVTVKSKEEVWKVCRYNDALSQLKKEELDNSWL